MEEQIKTMLDSVTELDSRNTLTAEKAKKWLSEYLERHEDELTRFPEISSEPHFDLLMADYDRLRDAVFVVAIFAENDVSLIAGRGDSAAIRQFAENDFPENTLEVIPELNKRFMLSGLPLIVPKRLLNEWLKCR